MSLSPSSRHESAHKLRLSRFYRDVRACRPSRDGLLVPSWAYAPEASAIEE